MTELPINTIVNKDWIEAAKGLPDGCVHVIVTSPPYWGQRNYGVDGQLGLEKTFEEHIAKLVEGFRELRRILRDDGQLWCNYGDKYASMKGSCHNPGGNENSIGAKKKAEGAYQLHRGNKSDFVDTGIKQGDLIGLAWRLALALQADGWILRSDVIWAKAVSFNDKYSGSTMPESVSGTSWQRCRVKVKGHTQKSGQANALDAPQLGNEAFRADKQAEWSDCPGCAKCKDAGGYVLRRGSWRPTRAHEYLFQFVKQVPYYADMEAVREDAKYGYSECTYNPFAGLGVGTKHAQGQVERMKGTAKGIHPEAGRNIRDVWTINPQAYPDAHYATFPEKLIEPIIKVATSQKGVCPQCGSQWARVIERQYHNPGNRGTNGPRSVENRSFSPGFTQRLESEATTLGWRPTCTCNAGDPVPAVVYDPFMGSGTVAAVSAKLGRNYMGSELSAEYMKQVDARVAEAETGIPAEEAKYQGALFAVNMERSL